MDIQQTRSRLRRTFAYPSDDDRSHNGDDDDAALDEQEQEDLIESLTTQNHETNTRFRLFLLALPILSTAPYLIALASSSRQQHQPSRALALLALTSLVSTAWLLYTQLPGLTGIAALDRWAASAGAEDTLHGNHGSHVPTRRRHRRGSFSLTDAVVAPPPSRSVFAALSSWTKTSSSLLPGGSGGRGGNTAEAPAVAGGPLALWLPYLNLGLCAVLVLAGLVTPSGASSGGAGDAATSGSWGHVGLNNLPAVVYVVVLAAKMVMGGVDPERELSGLKYDYKGA